MNSVSDFAYAGYRFRIDTRPGNERSASDDNAFTLVKGKGIISFYEDLATKIVPKNIIEIGVFQGGSYVLLDQIFQPERMTAIDIAANPVEPLEKYVSRRDGRFVHWGTSQSNESAIHKIVDNDLNGRLDLVIDDASHLYGLTRRTFEILFPRLQPGGTYIIEDWAWSHRPSHQSADSPWWKQPALSNLVFDLVTLLASTSLIEKIDIRDHAVLVTKSPKQRAVRHFKSAALWDALALRDKAMPRI